MNLKFTYNYKLSTTNFISILILLISLMGILSLLISNILVTSLQNNSYIINELGKLRMQSYRFLSQNMIKSESYVYLVETTLQSNQLKKIINKENLTSYYEELYNYWKESLLSSPNPPLDYQNVELKVSTFVNMVDSLTKILDEKTENRISYISKIQVIFFIFILSSLSILYLRHNIYYPWIKILNMLNSIRKKDFSQHYKNKNNEFNIFGKTLNKLSEELKQNYSNLDEKTNELNKKIICYLICICLIKR